MAERRKYLDRDGNPLPGATTVIGLLAKPALIKWAARIAAEEAVKAVREGFADEVAAKRGAGAPDRVSGDAADRGTSVHNIVEAWQQGDRITGEDAMAKAARRVVAYLHATETTLVSRELALVDQDRGFGGTLDLVIERGNRLLLGDLKTGKGVYPEVVIQLGAYAALWAHHNPTRPVDGAVVIHAPLAGGLTEYSVSRDQLIHGAGVFFALLTIHKTQPQLKLPKGESK